MPSTYTTNNGIELIATGEQSGTWGSTTNTNLELLDASLDGQVTVTLAATGTSGSPNTLPISDGSASNGRNRLVIFNDGSDLGGTAYVQLTPNDAEKIVYVRNSLSGSRSILLFQGTYNASNDYEVPAGTTAVVFFDGAGTGAVAANVFNNAHFDALNIVGNASVGGTLSVTSTSTFNDDVTFVGNTNNIVIDKSADSMIFQDASRLIFGTGSDLLIEHSPASTESRIWNYGGNLSIAQQVNDEDVDILSDDGSGGTASYFRADGSTGEAMLFHYGSEKLATKSAGIDVTGTVTDDGATHDGDVTFTGTSYNVVWDKSDNALEFADNAKATFGAGSDLQIYHDGTHNIIQSNEGNITIETTSDDKDIFLKSDDGAGGSATYLQVEGSTGSLNLRHYGDIKLATTSTGVDITGTLTSDGLTVDTNTLHVDSTNNRVGIGTTSPVGALNVVGDQAIFSGSAGTSALGVQIKGSALSAIPSAQVQGYIATGDSAMGVAGDLLIASRTSAAANIRFITGTSPAERMRIDSSGNLQLTSVDQDIEFNATTTAHESRLKWNYGGTLQSWIEREHSDGSMVFGNQGSERMRIDSSGNVGIGTSSVPSEARAMVSGGRFYVNSQDQYSVLLQNGGTSGGFIGTTGSDIINFFSSGGTERLRIDSSGNLLVGCTTTGFGNDNGFTVETTGFVQRHVNGTVSGTGYAFFTYNGSLIGSITQNGTTAVAYNTSSDYRLKEDVQPMVGASDRVLALNPVNFAWKVDGTRVDGFLAHEAQEVVPEAVTGEKDGEEMQAIDHSKLVPLLTAALQEALTKIEALEARLNALEGQ